jgi:hypothetical protein
MKKRLSMVVPLAWYVLNALPMDVLLAILTSACWGLKNSRKESLISRQNYKTGLLNRGGRG